MTVVVHDWGSALGFHWARRHAGRVRALIDLKALVYPVTWAEWPEAARRIFQALGSPAGEEMVLVKNIFVERILPASVLRDFVPEEMERYRAAFCEPGGSRRPTLVWPRETPIEGEPADVTALVDAYARWLSASPVPKLFVAGAPGAPPWLARSASSAAPGRSGAR